MEWPGSMQPDSDSDGSTDAESLRLYNEFQPVVRALCASYFDADDIAGEAGAAGLDNPYNITTNLGHCQAWRDHDE
jgi:hypothetical protein